MKTGTSADSAQANTRTDQILNSVSGDRKAAIAGFIILILLYIVTTVFVMITGNSEGVVTLMGQDVPLRSLTGAFSSVGNFCIVFLVLFYKKPGFITSLVFIIVSFGTLLFRGIVGHNPTTIAGFFSNLLILLAISLLYIKSANAQKYQERIREQAVTDRLTGLPNRFACTELIDSLVKRNEQFVVAVLDLNNFKNINNTLGQASANELLVKLGERLKGIADAGETETLDFVTRQAGDEFAIIVRNYRSEDDVVKTLSRYEEAVEEKITVDDCDCSLTAGIGYVEYPSDAEDSDTLLARAVLALAKARGVGSENSICRFSSDLLDAEHALEIEGKIRASLEDGSLFFDLQPQYDFSHRLVGFEALARIRNDDGSVMNPVEFIPVAEKAGLIDAVDHAVLRDAAQFLGELAKKSDADITLSANISARHLMKNNFLEEIREVVETCGVPAYQLEIEITESIMIDSVEKAMECMNEVKKMGVKIAIDDFGTGYSSLSYLSTFPADILKVDKSFIDQMNSSEASKKYVETIISIGHVMNFEVIAEGVEETEQLDTLHEIGCDYVQGFVWGRPMSPEAAEELVMSSTQ